MKNQVLVMIVYHRNLPNVKIGFCRMILAEVQQTRWCKYREAVDMHMVRIQLD